VVAAIHRQVDSFMHTCFQVSPYESYVALAEKLNQLTPGKFAKRSFFVNSGAEAVENAVKIARSHTGRPAIICFEDAFHGRTFMAMSLTSKTHPYKAGFEPFPGDVYRIPYAYCYRCSYSLSYPSCGIFCAHHLEDVFRRVVAAESVAAIIVEPVLGEGGFVIPPQEYFGILADVCRRHNILLIADEVQTGFGRTGALFACERYGIEPDIIVTAKSLGGGLPIGGITGRAEIMEAPGSGALGGTFGGNPVACAAALAVFETFESENLCARANELGERFHKKAKAWQSRWPMIGDVRGLGAMQAMELVRPGESREPAEDETKQVIKFCYEHGLLVLSAGSYGNVIRMLMPLSISDQQIEEGMGVLEKGLETVFDKTHHTAAQPA
jgi:4-aminobutyrate aminotransferase / (S)-3-amino-2-methylpropionate transaminase / 5-aminovalerate transaminase